MGQNRESARFPGVVHLGLGRRQFRQAEIGVAATAHAKEMNAERAGAGDVQRFGRSWNRDAQLEARALPGRDSSVISALNARARRLNSPAPTAAVPVRPASKRRRRGSRRHCRPPITPGLWLPVFSQTATRVAPACFSRLRSASLSIPISSKPFLRGIHSFPRRPRKTPGCRSLSGRSRKSAAPNRTGSLPAHPAAACFGGTYASPYLGLRQFLQFFQVDQPAPDSRSSSLRRISSRICRLMKLCSGPSWKSEAIRCRSCSRARLASSLVAPRLALQCLHTAIPTASYILHNHRPACP